jgi:hypothetical protein
MTIKTTSIPANRHLKQKTNNKRLDVSPLFRLPFKNKPSGVFETALGDQLVS